MEITRQEGRTMGLGRRGWSHIRRLHLGLRELRTGGEFDRADQDVEPPIGAREEDFPGQRGAGACQGKGQEAEGG